MSDTSTVEDSLAQRQLPKLKSLLNKYRQVKAMQESLLRLSELASTVTELKNFYPAMVEIIDSLLTTNSVHIALVNDQKELEIVYCHNPVEHRLAEHVEFNDWRKGLTGQVYLTQQALHCNAAERMALAKAGKIVLYGSACVDWLGVPLRRGHQVIGVIALQSYDQSLYFDDRDCQLLEFIGEHLVTAIDRVKSRALLEQSIEQRTKKLTESNRRLQREICERQQVEMTHQVLLGVSEVVATSKNLPSLFEQVHQQLLPLLACQNFYVVIKQCNQDKQESTEVVYQKDADTIGIDSYKRLAIFTELALKIAKPLVIAQGQLVTLNADGTKERAKYLLDFDSKSKPQTWLAAPLIEHGQPIGIIATQHYSNQQAYHEKHLEMFRFVAQQVTSAVVRERDLSLVEQSKESLEQIVNERTQALQTSNYKLRMQIEERRKAESRLYFEAHHDALTRLPNRALFTDRLTHALRHIKRHVEHSFAVLFIDLDRFKLINDTLGHHIGDKFLIEIAERLSSCVRDNDVLARLGGDEFVILLDSLTNQDDVEDVAERIIEAVSQPFDLDGHCLYSNASIGIAQCTPAYKDASEILRDADAAMYQAKNLGRGRYVFFDDSMREQLLKSMTLEQELRAAIKQQQFELHYQQISNLERTNTIGFEALLRWQHPEKGLLTPSEFLFMAEETGLIVEIERWLIGEVVAQLSLWQSSPDISAEYQNALIAINLSSRYLTQHNQLNELIAVIKDQSIEPHRLILEFDESAILPQPDLALASLRKLKKLGVKLALDDYGASQSSFNFIHQYPFEFIKLDRSFIRSLNNNDKHLSLVTALHQLGNKFGYRLVAEGIENQETLAKLQAAGCDFGQGYFIAKPSKLAQAILPLEDKTYA
ncbi:sensor domain-containing phosphodiesterase [Thalassotalea euphylliae]|uniref:EAL domain-containing protein n=1 Tax=Thalassotalea euphylliae TaxID=1655234 RepID=A0A3E0UKM0_9GAMM|nr:EAL domain-containing protein [Thalassotalea euphylliae]REL37197.1 EAL domain-containing protein [Thalassotalea euphylliae]